jgi:hypothetical protein
MIKDCYSCSGDTFKYSGLLDIHPSFEEFRNCPNYDNIVDIRKKKLNKLNND